MVVIVVLLVVLVSVGAAAMVAAGRGDSQMIEALACAPSGPDETFPGEPFPVEAAADVVVPDTRLSARLTFVDCLPRHVLVDCTVDDDDNNTPALPPGMPISIMVRRLDSPWMAHRVDDLLQSWALRDERVEVGIGPTAAGRRAEIVHGNSRLVFELESLTGVR